VSGGPRAAGRAESRSPSEGCGVTSNLDPSVVVTTTAPVLSRKIDFGMDNAHVAG
jgi:hypothetical protein